MQLKSPPGLVKKDSFIQRSLHKLRIYLSTIRHLYFIPLMGCFLIIGLHLLTVGNPIFNRFESLFLDAFFKYRPSIAAHPAIIYIEIAEDSQRAIHRFPWPRRYFAVLTHILSQWGAKAIVLDLLFANPSSNPFNDVAFSETIEKSGQVYLPVFLEQKGQEKIWVHSLADFETRAKAMGHINVNPDQDGILRRIRPHLVYEGVPYDHLGLEVAYDYLGEKFSPTDPSPFPLDEDGNLIINWAGTWAKTFPHYSFVDVLRSFEAVTKGEKPLISPETIKDKICLVGVTMSGGTDIKPIPLEPTFPGVGVLANVINSVLTRQFVRPATWNEKICFLVVGGLIAILFLVPFRTVLSPIAGFFLIFTHIGIAFFLFSKYAIWLPIFQSISLVGTLFVFASIYAKIAGDRERTHFFKLATKDGLTGLYVMRHFQELLKNAVEQAQKKNEPLSLILIDTDLFKQINDTYSHLAGDLVLKHVAQLILSSIRNRPNEKDSDFAGRYGGDEFIAALIKTNTSDAAFKVAERIRKSAEESKIEWQGKQIPLTLSIGVTMLQSDDKNLEAFLKRADEALYRAKEQGRNRTCLEEYQGSKK